MCGSGDLVVFVDFNYVSLLRWRRLFRTKVFFKIKVNFQRSAGYFPWSISRRFFKIRVWLLNDHRNKLFHDYDFRIGALFIMIFSVSFFSDLFVSTHAFYQSQNRLLIKIFTFCQAFWDFFARVIYQKINLTTTLSKISRKAQNQDQTFSRPTPNSLLKTL